MANMQARMQAHMHCIHTNMYAHTYEIGVRMSIHTAGKQCYNYGGGAAQLHIPMVKHVCHLSGILMEVHVVAAVFCN
jgi:hypothetical protein